MRVRDIMTRDPKTCSAKTTLQDAAFLMREAGCGILPVLEQGRLIGVVTDRDICLDLAERDKPASEIEVSDAMSWRVYFCNQNDRISQALETMTIKQVRRLPVADDDGRLCGILSIDDVPSPALRFRDLRLWRTGVRLGQRASTGRLIPKLRSGSPRRATSTCSAGSRSATGAATFPDRSRGSFARRGPAPSTWGPSQRDQVSRTGSAKRLALREPKRNAGSGWRSWPHPAEPPTGAP